MLRHRIYSEMCMLNPINVVVWNRIEEKFIPVIHTIDLVSCILATAFNIMNIKKIEKTYKTRVLLIVVEVTLSINIEIEKSLWIE